MVDKLYGIAIIEFDGNKKRKIFSESPGNIPVGLSVLSKNLDKDMKEATRKLKKRINNKQWMVSFLTLTFSYAVILRTVLIL